MTAVGQAVADDVPASTPGFFHAIAIDYDGTLATHGRPDPPALEALAETRASGRRVVLVTGRILAELREVFPEVDRLVDLVVAENGCVLSHRGAVRLLAPPVPYELDAALRRRGVPHRRGQVLLECSAAHELDVLAEVRRLGLDLRLARNREALMVLPAGVTKGTGLHEGLGDLGISHHSTIAVGDAENDHSLMDMAEVGVAVENAVDALKAHADLVLSEPDGLGIASLLRGPVVTGRQRVHPKRWQIEIGALDDGTPVTLPASQLNLLVTGSPRRGKSYVAGLVAERLIQLGYSVLVFDPEGDHASLASLRGVLAVGGGTPLPHPEELVRLVSHRFGSVVVDLSGCAAAERAEYLRVAPAAIESHRARTGLPHWVVVDEAQEPLGRQAVGRSFLDPTTSGYCLVTYRPDDLCAEALLLIDAVIALPGRRDVEETVDLLAAAGAMRHHEARALVTSAGPGYGVLVDRARPGGGTVFAVGRRDTSHLRHWHKYAVGGVPRDRRFYFRRDWDSATGTSAGSIEELELELRGCPAETVAHHCSHQDLSRWVTEVLGDLPLGAAVAAAEDDLRRGVIDVERGRDRLLDAIHERVPAG